MEIVEVSLSDRADAMSVQSDTAVNDHVFNMSDYHHVNIFVRIRQIEDLNIPLCDADLSYVTSLRTSSR